MMQNEKTITFDKLPEAVGYLTEQVIELDLYIGTERHIASLQER